MRLAYSRMPFVRAYFRETKEMVFDAHDRAFASYGGVCRRGIYDNMRRRRRPSSSAASAEQRLRARREHSADLVHAFGHSTSEKSFRHGGHGNYSAGVLDDRRGQLIAALCRVNGAKASKTGGQVGRSKKVSRSGGVHYLYDCKG